MLRRLSLLRIPIQPPNRSRAALAAIDRANVGNSDPAVQEAREHLSAALAAVGGSNGLRRRLLRSSAARPGRRVGVRAATRRRGGPGRRRGAPGRPAGRRDAAGRRRRWAAGEPGLSTVAAGAGTRCRARSGATASPPSSLSLMPSPRSAVAAVNGRRAARRERRAPRHCCPSCSRALAPHRRGSHGPRSAAGAAWPVRAAPHSARDRTGFTGILPLGLFNGRRLQGARPEQREAIAGLVDSANGGRKARILVMPDVPTNDPRQDHIVDEVRGLAHRFQRATGIAAPVAGRRPS